MARYISLMEPKEGEAVGVLFLYSPDEVEALRAAVNIAYEGCQTDELRHLGSIQEEMNKA